MEESEKELKWMGENGQNEKWKAINLLTEDCNDSFPTHTLWGWWCLILYFLTDSQSVESESGHVDLLCIIS